ncbi:hypothetical protein JO972_01235 [Verrucomicrobiaceae bacterium 5K15]|uniref:SCP domain-containing protein n=1 Tax=Oceaniferula flava TaxID=2800421 RepID=A0AAE2SBQ9_9BACT|nr:CAP domain-containing protein [Oceaniferula flavus]MBK1853570.1 hypothetical protein [Oceaniferula flavus]MBM1134875.1 hypothetical protein [Oceaniferula flavus]
MKQPRPMTFNNLSHCRVALVLMTVALLACLPMEAAELSAAFKANALAAMKHSSPNKRKAAYRTFQHLGNEVMEDYLTLLQQAQLHHQGAMRRAMSVRANPYIEHATAMDQLTAERERVMELIHTDWKKAPGKIRMLENEVEGIERKYKQLVKLAQARTESIDKNMTTAMDALVEIQWELTSLERLADGDTASDLPKREEIRELVLENSFEAEEWQEQREKRKLTLKSVTDEKAAREHNAACKWANNAQRDFSDHLNHARIIMGLNPMLLEEKLSEAAWGHSNDMRTGGFFSHTSPIDGKTTPAQRAKKAQFAGNWTGENIFMGSPSYSAAYNGWFGSDGHRFIMFSRGGSNVIGVGVDGGHWTMMTGRQ